MLSACEKIACPKKKKGSKLSSCAQGVNFYVNELTIGWVIYETDAYLSTSMIFMLGCSIYRQNPFIME